MTDPRQHDVRTVHRYIQKGVLSRQDFEKLLQDLPDLEPEAEFVDYESKIGAGTGEKPFSGAESVPVFLESKPEVPAVVPAPEPAPAPPAPAPPAVTDAPVPSPSHAPGPTQIETTPSPDPSPSEGSTEEPGKPLDQEP